MNRKEDAFRVACEIYREYGVNPVKAMENLKEIPVSIHHLP